MFVAGSTYHDQIVAFRLDHFDRFFQIGTEASGTFGELKTLSLMRQNALNRNVASTGGEDKKEYD